MSYQLLEVVWTKDGETIYTDLIEGKDLTEFQRRLERAGCVILACEPTG